jgi:hypothetical protein
LALDPCSKTCRLRLLIPNVFNPPLAGGALTTAATSAATAATGAAVTGSATTAAAAGAAGAFVGAAAGTAATGATAPTVATTGAAAAAAGAIGTAAAVAGGSAITGATGGAAAGAAAAGGAAACGVVPSAATAVAAASGAATSAAAAGGGVAAAGAAGGLLSISVVANEAVNVVVGGIGSPSGVLNVAKAAGKSIVQAASPVAGAGAKVLADLAAETPLAAFVNEVAAGTQAAAGESVWTMSRVVKLMSVPMIQKVFDSRLRRWAGFLSPTLPRQCSISKRCESASGKEAPTGGFSGAFP